MKGIHAIAHGDVLACLRELPDNEFDGLLADPPYGFRFMGKAWDYDVPSVDVWREALRVLKPGAPLLSFGGARTFHRIAIGIEDAGFELRDCLQWNYAKGFPKSQNVSLAIDKAAGAERLVVGSRVLTGNAAISTKEKGGTYGIQVGSIAPKEVPVTAPATELAQQWEGWGTALAPSWEPIILARKPLDGTMAANVAKWGVGGLAIDACRIGWQGPPSGWSKTGSKASENVAMSGANYAREAKPDADGRWPKNTVYSHSPDCCLIGTRPGKGFARNRQTDGAHPFGHAAGAEYTSESVADVEEVWACVSDCPVRILDSVAAPSKSVPFRENTANGNVLPLKKRAAGGYSDSGGPSRFFPRFHFCPKVSTKEREYGCEALPHRSAGEVTGGREDDSDGLSSPRAGAGRSGGARNHHPTLKPLSLAKWLASLIKPPTEGAALLVPYSGAGSEMIGALQAGWPLVFGIEGEAEYIEIANARIAAWAKKVG